jgi:hypothetical protein
MSFTQTAWNFRYFVSDAQVGSTGTGAFAFGVNPRVRISSRNFKGFDIQVLKNGQWVQVAKMDVSVIGAPSYDNTAPWSTGDFSTYTVGIGTKNVATGPVTFSQVVIGHALPIGIRDQQLIRYEDGSPVVRNGEYYFSATSGEPYTGGGFSESGPIILAVNRTTMVPRVVGWVYMQRPFFFQGVQHGSGPLGDAPLHIIFDRTSSPTPKFVVLASKYGQQNDATQPINVTYGESFDDIIAPGEHTVTPSNQSWITLADGYQMAYDPCIRYFGGMWHMVYASSKASCTGYGNNNVYRNSPTLAGLATAANVDLASAGEGGKFLTFGGRLYIILSAKVYSVVAGVPAYLGNMTITLTGLTYPHLDPFPVPGKNGGTVWKLSTFDQTTVWGNFTWGQWHIFESQELAVVETN